MTEQQKKKVFVSGCYDMLHSGHVAFFEEAAQYGDLYVGIGSDSTIYELKARKTVNPENERLYMVKSLKAVKDAWINSGSGLLDFEEDLEKQQPNIFFVNTDGHTPLKEELCNRLGIKYIVSERKPHADLPTRSTTALRKVCNIPYRLDLAGGWLDQPMVNKFVEGGVITLCIEPDYEFNDRSGMATSSRKKAIELWQTEIPEGDKEKLGKTLFCCENPPGTKYVSGSQDALGITMPGLNRFSYNNDYLPSSVDSMLEDNILTWFETHIWLIPLYPRKANYDVLANTSINEEKATRLSHASAKCWEAILRKDIQAVGKAMIESFEAQIAMFPNMVNDDILQQLSNYKNIASGWKISGAGGGGYLILFSEKPIEKAIRIRAKRG
jgi:cytidyltransferase-like protein